MGRHNALDKLIGGLRRSAIEQPGFQSSRHQPVGDILRGAGGDGDHADLDTLAPADRLQLVEIADLGPGRFDGNPEALVLGATVRFATGYSAGKR